ncbi:helicase-related protein [Micrococcus sp. IITD107]|uniref:helicase-related protein n=1 Tax=Micrococcus sp. IITD107 TaxID=3342790 RepID=UPI0035BB6038
MTESRPGLHKILDSLKPFQRATVEHAFRRLWTDEDRVDRFLVADEVGLGKTLVAKGIAARAIDHLWDEERPITLVYICSNGQIARQNLRRLRDLTGGELQDNADRLTMLPATMRSASRQRLQLVAFTPGTSLDLGNSTGMVRERALLHWMLRQVLGQKEVSKDSWSSYLAVGVRVERFRERLRWRESRPDLDPALLARFEEYLRSEPGPHGGTLMEDLLADQARWASTPRRGDNHWRSRRPVIGGLRMAMANVSVEMLAPDLVILDEFQRFKDLFSDSTAQRPLTHAQQLAQRVISRGSAKTLVLSATPYKMYTLPDEQDGDDHYRDFTNTITFLAGKDPARTITKDLSRLREGILHGTEDGMAAAETARASVEAALRRVMSRTERLSATPDRDGMLIQRSLGEMRLEEDDVSSWLASDAIARQVGSQDAFEFWRSAPYCANLMERHGYQLQERFLAHAENSDDGLRGVLRKHRGTLLDWEKIRDYQSIALPNAKMRALVDDLMAHEAWKLAWVAPSLPYLEPAGVYASDPVQSFTKRLIFSAWSVVPKAVASLVSYDVERRLRAASQAVVDERHRYGDRRTAIPLAFNWDAERELPRNLPNLTVIYPSVTLAKIGDPLLVAAEHGWKLPLKREEVAAVVQEKITRLLAEAGVHPQPGAEGARRRWYGVAPYLLDKAYLEDSDREARLAAWTDKTDDSRLVEHMRWAIEPIQAELGDPPEDLAHVLTLMALGGPGVCALRALARAEGGTGAVEQPELRLAAVTAAKGMRSLFNKPEIVSAVRGAAGETAAEDVDSYWNQVLRYGVEGNLQSVLDEFVHALVESEGLSVLSPGERAAALADKIAATASIRSASNEVQDVRVQGRQITVTKQHLNSHVAARFGRHQSSDAAVEREATIREGYTSPFWPFVMASTSVGQEGLDFHTYSHAVVHWNLPSNPVDLEQREGRVHRYKGHAVRKNVARAYAEAAVRPGGGDPWAAMFASAEGDRPEGDSLINPYWVFPLENGAMIERYVPAMPLSREAKQYEQLRRTVGAYRFVMGQPRQEDLIQYLGADAEKLRIDLSPPPPVTPIGSDRHRSDDDLVMSG